MFPNGFGGAFGGGFMGMPQGPFEQTYRCFPISFHGMENAEKGDKIVLPISTFEKLASMTITYPIQFELRNEDAVDANFMDLTNENAASHHAVKKTHVGVLEFTAKEGQCFVPYWIMQKLLIPEGGLVHIKNVTLPLAQYMKFRPQTSDFLEISNPKAVLESVLRNFSCVTKNDLISLPYNGRNYVLDVVDVQPQDACSIVEADVKVDFEAPPGYEEPKVTPAKAPAPAPAPGSSSNGEGGNVTGTSSTSGGSENNTLAELAKARQARLKQLEKEGAQYVAFSGKGQRVDGKKKGEVLQAAANAAEEEVAVPVQTARKGKWKSKTKGGSFQGPGQTLS